MNRYVTHSDGVTAQLTYSDEQDGELVYLVQLHRNSNYIGGGTIQLLDDKDSTLEAAGKGFIAGYLAGNDV